jgi:20S proteasome alpha/beta subunit
MTVLAAIQGDSECWIATDSRRTSYWHNIKDDCVKVCERDGFIFAGTGMAKGIQAIENFWEAPIRKYEQDSVDYVLKTIGNSIFDCLKSNNCTTTKDNRTLTESVFIFCYDGSLYEFGNCGLVQVIRDYAAHGSGMEFALGSLFTTQHYDIDTKERLEMAINSASYHSAFCGGDIKIYKQTKGRV